MRRFALALICAVTVGQARGAHTAIELLQRNSRGGQKRSSSSDARDPLIVLTKLILAHNRAAAFNPCTPIGRLGSRSTVPAISRTRLGHCAHMRDTGALGLVRRPAESDPDITISFVDEHGEEIDVSQRVSPDGGSEEEFQLFWQNDEGFEQRLPGGWFKLHAHPQVNVDPYWYQPETGEIVWEMPKEMSESDRQNADATVDGQPAISFAKLTVAELKERLKEKGLPVSGTKAVLAERLSVAEEAAQDATRKHPGPSGGAAHLSVEQIRAMLASPGEVPRQGYNWEDIARRACFEYEQLVPRVHSWHDYKHITPWTFFEKTQAFGAKGSRDKRAEFAEDAFFRALANVATENMHRIHPINLMYMLWAFTRARVIIPEFMNAAADYICDGRFPMLDRCALGMGLRDYAEQKVSNKKLFECAAKEIRRPTRLRSLAPRNIQNLMFAYSRLRVYDEGLLGDLARMTARLLDGHDTRSPKTKDSVQFGYICKEGTFVPCDMFRVGKPPSLTMTLQGFVDLKTPVSILEPLIEAVAEFAQKSIGRSPKMLLEPRDFVGFVHELSRAAQMGCTAAVRGLEKLAVPVRSFCAELPDRDQAKLADAYRRAGVEWPSEVTPMDWSTDSPRGGRGRPGRGSSGGGRR